MARCFGSWLPHTSAGTQEYLSASAEVLPKNGYEKHSRLLNYNEGQYMHFNKPVKAPDFLPTKACFEACLLKSQGRKEESCRSNADSKRFQQTSNLFPQEPRICNIFVALLVLSNYEGSVLAKETTQAVRWKILRQDVLIRFWDVLKLVCFHLLGPSKKPTTRKKEKSHKVKHSPLSFLEELHEVAFYSRSNRTTF